MNTDFARQRMVEQQVRTWDVSDKRVLTTLAEISRDQFVPSMYADLAYADTEIPLGNGQCMLRPSMDGRILQTLDLRAGDSVLEIGTGNGFLTACLANLAESVTSVEIFDDFVARARGNLAGAGVENVQLHCQDALVEIPPGDFDAIVVSGSAALLHQPFVDALRPGGRLFAVIGESPAKSAILVSRSADQEYRTSSLFETDIPHMVNATENSPFFF
jgi:protein-L-isoaspartate(D-aspartate) O-methyltransferase